MLNEPDEDWSQNFDDLDGEFWEIYMGGPDDYELELYQDGIMEMHEEECEDDFLNYGGRHYEEPDEKGNEMDELIRKEEIVEWLSESEVAMKFQNSDGFLVYRGPHLRMKNGWTVDLLDWLYEEGIEDGAVVAEYNVVYSAPESEFGEKLSFSKIIIDAPFVPLSAPLEEMDCDSSITAPTSSQEETDFDDDIPF